MIKISKNTNKRTNKKKIKRTVLGFIHTIFNLKSMYTFKKI